MLIDISNFYLFFFFFFNDTATTEIYTLSLHDALPIFAAPLAHPSAGTKAKDAPRIVGGPGRNRELVEAAIDAVIQEQLVVAPEDHPRDQGDSFGAERAAGLAQHIAAFLDRAG